MLTCITNFISDCKAGCSAVIDESYGTTVTVYESKVAQAAHTTAVKFVGAIRWFIGLCARVNKSLVDFVSDHYVVSALVMPAVVVGAVLCAAGVYALCGSITLLAFCIILEIYATIHVAYMLCAPAIRLIDSSTTSYPIRCVLGFITGCAATVIVMAYKALLIAAFMAIFA